MNHLVLTLLLEQGDKVSLGMKSTVYKPLSLEAFHNPETWLMKPGTERWRK